MTTAIAAVAFALLYFVPTITAVARPCDDPPKVFVVNLLLGWSMLGWLWALALANRPTKGVTK